MNIEDIKRDKALGLFIEVLELAKKALRIYIFTHGG